MGQLNIKDEELIAEMKALAAELGTSVVGALREAVRARRAERAREREAKLAEIMAIGARVAAMVPPGLRTSDHSDLYDENGLPR
jgi:antitoxin VapB